MNRLSMFHGVMYENLRSIKHENNQNKCAVVQVGSQLFAVSYYRSESYGFHGNDAVLLLSPARTHT